MSTCWKHESRQKEDRKRSFGRTGRKKASSYFHPVVIGPIKERESLLAAIKTVFQDVLNDENEKHMVLLVKSERWNGEFVELHGSAKQLHCSLICGYPKQCTGGISPKITCNVSNVDLSFKF